jgi:Collagen triple helix repeat (20 copies)
MTLAPTGPQVLEGILLPGTKRNANQLAGRITLYDPDGNPIDLAAGSQGPKGDPGPEGPVGPVGPIGPIGPAGAQGTAGSAGPKGDPGLIGPKGDKGDKGDQGLTGPQGLTGTTGQQGPPGTIGATGGQGPAGVAGPKGDVGSQGPQGLQGVKGDKGDKGDTGPQGSIGATGVQGPQGIQGPAGVEGPQGDPADISTVLQLLVSGDRKISFGTSSVSVVGGGAASLTIPHGLGKTPVFAIAIATDNNDSTKMLNFSLRSVNATSCVYTVKRWAGAATSDTHTVWWVAIA